VAEHLNFSGLHADQPAISQTILLRCATPRLPLSLNLGLCGGNDSDVGLPGLFLSYAPEASSITQMTELFSFVVNLPASRDFIAY
jgi:hypothetical protein